MCDHDRRAEAALRSLGGTASACAGLFFTWHDYRIEPLLVGALLSGRPGMLACQTLPVFGPSIGRPSRPGLFGSLEPLLTLDEPFRLRLAASSAIAMARACVTARALADDGIAVTRVLRDCVASALAVVAPGLVFDVRLDAVDAPAGRVVTLARTVDGIEVRGTLPVDWLALFALGVATHGSALVTSVRPGAATSTLTCLDVAKVPLPQQPRTVRVPTDALIEHAAVPPLTTTSRW